MIPRIEIAAIPNFKAVLGMAFSRHRFVYFRREDEVVSRQASGDMGPEINRERAPADLELGVVILAIGNLPYDVGVRKRGAKIRSFEDPHEMVASVIEMPIPELGQKRRELLSP
jgi:hypothetical protein